MLPLFLKSKKQKKSVLYLAAFFPENAGYHWRVEKWAEILKLEGYDVHVFSVFSKNEFYKHYNYNQTSFLIKFLRKRFWQVVKSRNYDTIIVRRELLLFNDYGNLFLEKLLLKWSPNAILDFDDDIAAAKGQPKEILKLSAKVLLENGDKFNQTLQIYKRFIVASNYLKSRVLKLNKSCAESDVCVIPTCVDYNKYPRKNYLNRNGNIVFGWIGGDHNYPLLIPIFEILNELSNDFQFSFVLIGGNKMNYPTNFPIQFFEWSLEHEVEFLKKIDIGIMPLIDDSESWGKGGFKLIQYMGLGIVSVAAPIGINKEIIIDHVNSFFAHRNEEWLTIFKEILKGNCDFNDLGEKARIAIDKQFTFSANKDKYQSFIGNYENYMG